MFHLPLDQYTKYMDDFVLRGLTPTVEKDARQACQEGLVRLGLCLAFPSAVVSPRSKIHKIWYFVAGVEGAVHIKTGSNDELDCGQCALDMR